MAAQDAITSLLTDYIRGVATRGSEAEAAKQKAAITAAIEDAAKDEIKKAALVYGGIFFGVPLVWYLARRKRS